MRMLMTGLAGWARMEKTTNERLKLTDTAITVIGTMLVAVTWAMLQR